MFLAAEIGKAPVILSLPHSRLLPCWGLSGWHGPGAMTLPNLFSNTKEKNMKTLQKAGGIAALYMAAAHLIGIIIFLIVLDYLSITDPAQKVALNVEKQTVVFSTNLLMYVFF